MALPREPRAVVTGGASGLGRSFCLALARRQARVLVVDIDVAAAEETAYAVAQQGGQAQALRCDVTRPDDVAAAAAAMERLWGGTDLLVNNAGVAVAGPLEIIPRDDWDWILRINLSGVIHGCQAFIPQMKQRGHGHILNVASLAGLITTPDLGPYNVTKAGVIALSETLAAELAPSNIGVTVLCPGFFPTGIIQNSRGHGGDPEKRRRTFERLMARSKLTAADVAERALMAVERDQLHVLPHSEGAWLWRLKRLAPGFFHQRFVPWVLLQWRKGGRSRPR